MHRFARALVQRAMLVLLGLALTAALLVSAEGVLRLLDVGGEARKHDPFAGFSNLVPMFEPATRDDGIAVMRTARARKQRAPAEFLAEKPANGFRAFVVGGSSAAGTPYGYDLAFSAWLDRRMEAAFPDRPVEVVNAALDAYATRRILEVVRELAVYEPDLLVVYSGHNELAEARYYSHLTNLHPALFRLWTWAVGTRLYAVLADVATALGVRDPLAGQTVEFGDEKNAVQYFAAASDHIAGSESSERELAYREIHYRHNLIAMIDAMRAVGARTALLSLSQNYADWPPGASSHAAAVDADQRERFAAHLERGDALTAEDRCADALDAYRAALAIDDSYAALHFAIATCERRLGIDDSAAASYLLASDLDRVPNGAPSRYNEILREVAATDDALFVDTAAAIDAATPSGLIGDQWFLDLVHPNIAGHQLIAKTVAEALREAGIPEEASRWQAGYRDPDPATLYAQDPGLHIGEMGIRAVACMLTGRPVCALENANAVLALDPAHPGALQVKRALEPPQ